MERTIQERCGIMSKLIDVDDIDWQEGVFVTPKTKEPLPIIHKIATIEMLRDWQEEVKAIPLDKIKQAREEISKQFVDLQDGSEEWRSYVNETVLECVEIMDRLIESEEKE